MKYFPFVIGDWVAATRWLTATERGVYLDLLTVYYDTEKPLMQMQCKRIQDAYAENERDAMQRILNEFFVFEDGVWRHPTCDKILAEFQEKGEKKRKAAETRWKRNADAMQMQSECNADAEQMQCERNAIKNKELKIKNNNLKIVEQNTEIPDFSVENDSERETTKNHRIAVPDSLPPEWEQDARIARPDIDITRAWNYFRSTHAPTSSRRTFKRWHADWMRVVAQQFPVRNRQPQGYSNPALQTTESTIRETENGDF